MDLSNIKLKIKIGIILIIISSIFFVFMLIIPFIQFDNTIKIIIGSICLVIGEICFWIGGLLIGKELFDKYKSKINPKNWFTKNKKYE